MKNIYYLSMVISLLLSIEARGEYFISYASHLVEIKTKPNTSEAKSTNISGNPKYASVTFVTDKREQIKFNCNDGWVMRNNICEVDSCDGYPYTREETENCKTVDMCLSGDVMKYKCTTCGNGLESDGKGGCVCNSSIYPYNTKTFPCMYQYDSSEESCAHVDSTGKTTVYYKDCLCPVGWKQCLDSLHHVGMGSKCVSGGKDYYASCKCNSNYNKTCIGVEIENPHDYCVDPLSGQIFYQECFSCDIGKNEIHEEDYHNFWCSGWGWVDFESIHGFYLNRGE